MTIEQLKKRNGIYFENIQEGFEQYENTVITQDAFLLCGWKEEEKIST